MADFMQLEITQKGRLVSAECGQCSTTLYAHEWATWDFNETRDAMETGTLQCDCCCIGYADPDTYHESRSRNWYAARYSAPGYLDCTDWSFGTNKRELLREVRELYG